MGCARSAPAELVDDGLDLAERGQAVPRVTSLRSRRSPSVYRVQSQASSASASTTQYTEAWETLSDLPGPVNTALTASGVELEVGSSRSRNSSRQSLLAAEVVEGLSAVEPPEEVPFVTVTAAAELSSGSPFVSSSSSLGDAPLSCAICFDELSAADALRLTCCGKPGSSVAFCAGCIKRTAQAAVGHNAAVGRCPGCRALFVLPPDVSGVPDSTCPVSLPRSMRTIDATTLVKQWNMPAKPTAAAPIGASTTNWRPQSPLASTISSSRAPSPTANPAALHIPTNPVIIARAVDNVVQRAAQDDAHTRMRTTLERRERMNNRTLPEARVPATSGTSEFQEPSMPATRASRGNAGRVRVVDVGAAHVRTRMDNVGPARIRNDRLDMRAHVDLQDRTQVARLASLAQPPRGARAGADFPLRAQTHVRGGIQDMVALAGLGPAGFDERLRTARAHLGRGMAVRQRGASIYR